MSIPHAVIGLVTLVSGVATFSAKAVEARYSDQAIPAEQHLHQAESFFRQGLEAAEENQRRQAYLHAAEQFQFLTEDGYDDPALFLDLGNARFLGGELPQAILAYRRGLQRDPLNAQLWENLEASRDLVGYTDGALRHRPDGDGWPPWLPRPSPTELLQTSLVLYVVPWMVASVWLVARRRWLVVAAAMLFLTACMAAGWWGYLHYRVVQDVQHRLAVVAVNGVTLRRGNGPLYPAHPDLPAVNRGMEAELLNERGGWVNVQFPAGERGWLPRDAVLMDR